MYSIITVFPNIIIGTFDKKTHSQNNRKGSLMNK